MSFENSGIRAVNHFFQEATDVKRKESREEMLAKVGGRKTDDFAQKFWSVAAAEKELQKISKEINEREFETWDISDTAKEEVPPPVPPFPESLIGVEPGAPPKQSPEANFVEVKTGDVPTEKVVKKGLMSKAATLVSIFAKIIFSPPASASPKQDRKASKADDLSKTEKKIETQKSSGEEFAKKVLDNEDFDLTSEKFHHLVDEHVQGREMNSFTNKLMTTLFESNPERAILYTKGRISYEVGLATEKGSLLRSETLLSKAMRQIYNHYTVDFTNNIVQDVLTSLENNTFEVNQFKINGSEEEKQRLVAEGQIKLLAQVDQLFTSIEQHIDELPDEVKELLGTFSDKVGDNFGPTVAKQQVASQLFLRCINPKLNTMATKLSPQQKRSIMLMTKVAQNAANGTQFSDKEEYMGFVNTKIKEFHQRTDTIVEKSIKGTKTENKAQAWGLGAVGKREASEKLSEDEAAEQKKRILSEGIIPAEEEEEAERIMSQGDFVEKMKLSPDMKDKFLSTPEQQALENLKKEIDNREKLENEEFYGMFTTENDKAITRRLRQLYHEALAAFKNEDLEIVGEKFEQVQAFMKGDIVILQEDQKNPKKMTTSETLDEMKEEIRNLEMQKGNAKTDKERNRIDKNLGKLQKKYDKAFKDTDFESLYKPISEMKDEEIKNEYVKKSDDLERLKNNVDKLRVLNDSIFKKETQLKEIKNNESSLAKELFEQIKLAGDYQRHGDIKNYEKIQNAIKEREKTEGKRLTSERSNLNEEIKKLKEENHEISANLQRFKSEYQTGAFQKRLSELEKAMEDRGIE